MCEMAAKPACGDDRFDASVAIFQPLGDMLREKGWQPSDAQVRELARLLAEHVRSTRTSTCKASDPTRPVPIGRG